MSSSAQVVDAERAAFARYLRTGRRASPLELKYNHNHDPDDGRFTFDGGGGAGRSGTGAGRVAGRLPSRTSVAAPAGPFRSAARRQDEVGAMARNVNAFVHGQADRIVVPLGGKDGRVTVTRLGGSLVELDHTAFTVRGRLGVTPGKEEIVIALERPILKLGYLSISTYPAHLRLFQAQSGKINYSVDGDLKVGLGRLGTTVLHRGTYLGMGSK